jgi:hypothetical protein
MLICHGIDKTPILLSNYGPVCTGQDWLLNRCNVLRKRHIPIFLEFQSGEYVRILHEETLLMSVEMAYSYYRASLDERAFPVWMNKMDWAWENHCSDDEDDVGESDSLSDDQADDYDYE